MLKLVFISLLCTQALAGTTTKPPNVRGLFTTKTSLDVDGNEKEREIDSEIPPELLVLFGTTVGKGRGHEVTTGKSVEEKVLITVQDEKVTKTPATQKDIEQDQKPNKRDAITKPNQQDDAKVITTTKNPAKVDSNGFQTTKNPAKVGSNGFPTTKNPAKVAGNTLQVTKPPANVARDSLQTIKPTPKNDIVGTTKIPTE